MAASRTALEILNAAQDELGLARSAGVTAADITTRQMMAFLNNAVEEMVQDNNWTGLELEAVLEFGAPTELSGTLVADSASITIADTTPFAATPTSWTVTGEGLQNGTRILSVTDATTLLLNKVADTSGTVDLTFVKDTFPFPDNFDRWIPQTQWDSRLMWEMVGPTSSQFDAFQRNGIVGPFPRRQFRRQGAMPNAFRIFPPPSASGSYPGTLTFRYITYQPIIAVDGSSKRFFTADSDVSGLPDRVLILGTKWRWKEQKGFDFAPQQQEYYNWFDSTSVSDRGEDVVPLDGSANYGLPDSFRYGVPDGNFPGE
jgi:hypothetical protein